jgi:hypothetical protein
LNFFDFIYFSYIFLVKDVNYGALGIGIVFLLPMIFYIIINSICLNINIKYVQNFLNKINIDFERYKCDSIWIFLLNIIGIIFFFYYLSIIVYKFLSDDEYNCLKSSTYESSPNENNTLVKKYNPVPSREKIRISISKKVDEKNKNKEKEIKRDEERIKVEEERKKVEEDRMKAEEERKKVEEDLIKAEEERKKAEEERKKAEEERKKAEEERKKVEEERKKIEEDDEKGKCICCMDNDAKVALIPCGHQCFCRPCFEKINSRRNNDCPICRRVFTNGIDVFNI